MLLALVFVAQMSLANVITGQAKIPDNYYNGVDGKKTPVSILDALYDIIKNHTVIGYSGLEPYYEQTDLYSDTIWDIYSTCKFLMKNAGSSQNEVCDCWNKEHTIPQSWFHEGTPMKSDLFHVYPTDARVNNFRSNLPYGEVSGNNGAGFPDNKGGHGLGKKGSNTFPGYSGTVFEPADEFKGDLARTYFYMVARYRSTNFTQATEGKAVFTYTSSTADLTDFARELFLKWHRNDPVSEKEIDRNQAVYGIQKNRNPFIDYPDLVEYIWGTKVNQQVDLASMTPTCEGGGATPVIIIKHGVDWMVNGEIIQTDSIQENKTVQELPTNPSSCSTESATFVGWTNAPITGITDDAPAVLYTSAKDIPAITDDIALYAVFAKATTIESSNVPVEVDFDFNKLCTDKKAVTSLTSGDVTLTFAKGTNTGSVPTYYSKGTGIRCYGGNTMTVTAKTITQIDFTFGTDENSNAILVNVGKFESPTWIGTADEVIFTIDGTSGNRRFATLKVTMNGNSSVTTYSRYQTTCSDPALHNIEQSESKAVYRKLLLNGQLYILANDQLYTITGQKVQK